MTRKQSKSTTRNPKTRRADLTAIWTAACHVAERKKESPLDTAVRAGLAPFIRAATELALATVANPDEDPKPLLELARMRLEEAKLVLPSIAERTPISQKAGESWQRALVRHALTTSREFSVEPDRPAPSPASDDDYEPYSPKRAADLENPDPSKLWMVEHLWQRSATGIIGGGAKGCKTWLALDIALSVASGTRALDRFEVHQPGGVLYVNAEGGEAYVKDRLLALCAHRGLDLDALPHELNVIPSAIRIDTADGIGRLKATIRTLAPTLLVLDPLVRLHRGDENSASSVSNLLSSLSELQQSFNLSLILVHHSTKQGARRAEMNGQDFRGSGDFHAWGSSNIAIRRKGTNRFIVSAEHRAAPATEKWTLEATTDENPRLQVVEDDGDEESAGEAREASREKLVLDIRELLRGGTKSITEIRANVKGSNARISEALARLRAAGIVVQVGRNWSLANGHRVGPRGMA